jgi:hypothetical protein
MALIPPTVSHSPQSNPLYASSTGAWISPQINADTVTAGALNCDILSANSVLATSIYIRGATFAAAATTSIDLSTNALRAAFPFGSYIFFETGDGVGSSATGFMGVGGDGTLSIASLTQGAILAPVTGVSVSVATTVISVAYAGKVATTTGYIRLTRCAI